MSSDVAPRVLFVDQTAELGGAELSLLDIVSRRPRTDLVTLFCDGPFRELLDETGIAVEALPIEVRIDKSSGALSQFAAAGGVIGGAWRLARRASGYDIIYANTQKSAVFGSLAAFFARRPMIWHLRDILSTAHFSSANLRAVIGLTNRFASRIIANSEHTASAYREAGGRKPVRVIHNGIASRPFDSIAAGEGARVRHEVGAPAEACLVGVFGRLTHWKGQHTLLEALRDPACRGVHAIVVGEALFTEQDRGYAEQLRGAAQHPTLQGRVHFLGHRRDVPALMNACDIIVHSSVEDEPFGRVIVEGMLAKRPVIAARGGGAIEIIEHGKTGLLTTPGDAGELAEAIQRLVNNAQVASELASNGRADAIRRFNVDERVADINAVIAEAACQSP